MSTDTFEVRSLSHAGTTSVVFAVRDPGLTAEERRALALRAGRAFASVSDSTLDYCGIVGYLVVRLAPTPLLLRCFWRAGHRPAQTEVEPATDTPAPEERTLVLA